MANALTVLRILMVPVFAVLLLMHGGLDPALRLWAFGVFCLAMLTDKIDGDIARKYNMITDFGKIADPIADKALMAAGFIGLAIIGALPWWIPVVILVREFGITILRFIIIRYAVLPASKGGKLKTVLQTVAVGLFIILLPVGSLGIGWLTLALAVLAGIALAAAVVVTVVTGVDYCVKSYRIVREARAA